MSKSRTENCPKQIAFISYNCLSNSCKKNNTDKRLCLTFSEKRTIKAKGLGKDIRDELALPSELLTARKNIEQYQSYPLKRHILESNTLFD